MSVLEKLEKAAREGYDKICNGDVFRPHLTDEEFDKVVGADGYTTYGGMCAEEDAIDQMNESGQWSRCMGLGFNFLPLLEEDNNE